MNFSQKKKVQFFQKEWHFLGGTMRFHLKKIQVA
jgi:hypothetical protein